MSLYYTHMGHAALRFHRDLSAGKNWKLWFPSRFEGAVPFGKLILASHYRWAPSCAVWFYLFPISGSLLQTFLFQSAKAHLLSLCFPARQPDLLSLLPFFLCTPLFASPSPVCRLLQPGHQSAFHLTQHFYQLITAHIHYHNPSAMLDPCSETAALTCRSQIPHKKL